jgi:hypothetical protein
LEEGIVELAVADAGADGLGGREDVEATGQVPPPAALDGEAVDGSPRFGLVPEHLELGRQPGRQVLQPEVDTGGEGLDRAPAARAEAAGDALGDAADAEGAGEDVALQRLPAVDLAQTTVGVAAEIVQLPETVLRLGVAEGEEEVVGTVRGDVGDAAAVTDDLGTTLQARPRFGGAEIGLLLQVAAKAGADLLGGAGARGGEFVDRALAAKGGQRCAALVV